MHPALQATIRQFQDARASNIAVIRLIEDGHRIVVDSVDTTTARLADAKAKLAVCDGWLTLNS
jgi:hypothetical protein